MAWSIEFSDEAERDFAKLDKPIQRRIFRYLHERVANASEPQDYGKRLQHHLANSGVTEWATTGSSAPSKKKNCLCWWLR